MPGKKQSSEVHRRIQENHRITISIRQNLRSDSEGIWRVLVRSVQLDKKIFPGKGG